MLVIDRFEGDFAIVETSAGMIQIPKADLPASAAEGDIVNMQVDGAATVKRSKRINALMDELFKD